MNTVESMRRKLFTILCIFGVALSCFGDVFVDGPTPPPGLGGPTLTSTAWPFLTREYGGTSMRYQQVYNASLFTNLDRSLIYITTMTFHLYPFGQGANSWEITNMQINLSTTRASADNLSTNFAANVGPDDTVVLGSQPFVFPGGDPLENQEIVFQTPFRYDPSHGNLLLDIRVFNGAGPIDPLLPTLWAYTTSTDEVSRVWAPDVNATTATGVDTTGLFTVIQFDGIPTLTVQFYPVYAGTESNIFEVGWPALPNTFVLQRSGSLDSTASWQTITNGILGSPQGGERFYTFPAATAGHSGFFRLVWPRGYGASLRSKPDSISRPIPTAP